MVNGSKSKRQWQLVRSYSPRKKICLETLSPGFDEAK